MPGTPLFSDPQDLYGLAQQAGYVTEYAPPPESPVQEGALDVSPPPAPGGPGDPVAVPWQADIQAAAAPAVVPSRPLGSSGTSNATSSSHSTSTAGLSPEIIARNKVTARGLQGKYDAADQVAQDRANQLAAGFAQADAAAGVATDQQAADLAAQADARARGQARISEFHAQAAVTEAGLAAQAQAAAAAKMANYDKALGDFRAARVDPSQLWKSMTGGEHFGTLVGAFVTDFLGAKGIHTSAMDTFNRAIDRNIDGQVRAMAHKGEVAQGFRELWDMQRAQSTTDQEARARVRGFMLQSAIDQVDAEVGGYDSKLALDNGAVFKAKLLQEQAKTRAELEHNAVAEAQADKSRLSQDANQAAAREIQRATIAEAKAAREAAAAAEARRVAADAQRSAMGRVIFDPLQDGKPTLIARDGSQAATNKDIARTAQETLSGSAYVIKALKRVEALQEKYGKVATNISLFSDQDKMELNSAMQDLRSAYIHTRLGGGQVSEADRADAAAKFPTMTMFSGKTLKALEGNVTEVLNKANTDLQGWGYQRLDQGTQAAMGPLTGSPFGEGEAAYAAAVSADQVGGRSEGAVDSAIGSITTQPTRTASLEDAQRERYTNDLIRSGVPGALVPSEALSDPRPEIPRFAAGMEDLADIVAIHSSAMPLEDRRRAVDELARYAAAVGDPSNPHSSDDQAVLAAYLLHRLDSDGHLDQLDTAEREAATKSSQAAARSEAQDQAQTVDLGLNPDAVKTRTNR